MFVQSFNCSIFLFKIVLNSLGLIFYPAQFLSFPGINLKFQVFSKQKYTVFQGHTNSVKETKYLMQICDAWFLDALDFLKCDWEKLTKKNFH
jgi:hypothetical protein